MTVEALFWPLFVLLCGCIAAVVWVIGRLVERFRP